jgi:tetratricopeptide (TPR) repeat protein
VQWVESTPDQPQAHVALAEIHLKLKDKKSALAAVQQGIAVLPTNKELLLREIQLLLLSEKDEQARAKIAKYTASHGQSAELEYIRGNNAVAKGNYKEALLHYQSLHQLKPSSQSVIGIAELYGKLGQKDKAIAELEKWLSSHKDDQPVRLYLANINLGADKSQAISQYEALVASNPKNVVALNNLAWALGEQGNVTDALKYAEQAYTLSPKVAPIIDTYGYLLLLSGNIPEALSKLQAAYDMQPNEPSISYHYALALKESGDIAQAKKVLSALAPLDFPEKEKAATLLKTL